MLPESSDSAKPSGAQTNDSQDELLAIVDELDRELGCEKRHIVHARGLLHRAVHVFLFDDTRRLLLQQRSATKDTFPLHWECVGGHLSPGETYYDAAIREVKEELGLVIAAPTFLCKLEACDKTGQEFIEVYRATITGTPAPLAAEVIAIDYLTPQQVHEEIRNNIRPYSPSTVHSIECSGVLSYSSTDIPVCVLRNQSAKSHYSPS